jgi:hypothetical protein
VKFRKLIEIYRRGLETAPFKKKYRKPEAVV